MENNEVENTMTHDLKCKILNRGTSQDEIIRELNDLDHAGWEELERVVSLQGIGPLFYAKLKPLIEKINIPTTIQANLHRSYISTAYKNTLILHNTASLISAMRSQNIPVIGLKGIYLVENIYDNIATRPFGDVDILVRKEDITRSVSILQEHDYKMSTYFDILDDNQDIKHVPPMINPDGLPVEIHWTLLEEDEPFTIDPKGFWDRAIPAVIAGEDTITLSLEDLIMHLCLHMGYQHHMSLGLRGLYDIAEVLHHFEGQIDWVLLIEIANQWGSTRVTWLTLTLAQDLLGAVVPKHILKQLEPKNAEPWVIEEAKSQLLNTRKRTGPMTPDLAELAEQKGVISRFRLILSRVFLPKQTLARLYGVPPTSIRIYGCYIKRLFELIRHYRSSVSGILRNSEEVLRNADNQRKLTTLKSWLGKK